jgi:hypothetical protein
MQQQPLPAVVVEVVEAVANTLYLTLAQEFDVTQVPQRSISLESSCCPEGNVRLPACQLTSRLS